MVQAKESEIKTYLDKKNRGSYPHWSRWKQWIFHGRGRLSLENIYMALFLSVKNMTLMRCKSWLSIGVVSSHPLQRSPVMCRFAVSDPLSFHVISAHHSLLMHCCARQLSWGVQPVAVGNSHGQWLCESPMSPISHATYRQVKKFCCIAKGNTLPVFLRQRHSFRQTVEPARSIWDVFIGSIDGKHDPLRPHHR